MPITIEFFSLERINNFSFISYGKNSFGIRPVWYMSKDLERIKDVYRGTTVLILILLPPDKVKICIYLKPTLLYIRREFIMLILRCLINYPLRLKVLLVILKGSNLY
jgi:hypothetical protein